MIDWAKMIGITPAVFTFRGMCVAAPPYIRRPTIFLAYCTGIRRWPWVIRMIAAITTTMNASRKISAGQLISPRLSCWKVRITSPG